VHPSGLPRTHPQNNSQYQAVFITSLLSTLPLSLFILSSLLRPWPCLLAFWVPSARLTTEPAVARASQTPVSFPGRISTASASLVLSQSPKPTPAENPESFRRGESQSSGVPKGNRCSLCWLWGEPLKGGDGGVDVRASFHCCPLGDSGQNRLLLHPKYFSSHAFSKIQKVSEAGFTFFSKSV